jgi:predicted enzyme related to lactoylglutathione lyase
MVNTDRAFSGFSVHDIATAQTFYRDVLGLSVSLNAMGFLNLHLANGGVVLIYNKPDHVPATFTILNFDVDDIDATVDDLAAHGIHMTKYEGMHQDEKGIARGLSVNQGPDIAWFTDPAGNILSVLQTMPSADRP